MKKIGFQNFRRFQDFPILELGNISIIVGRNNSGKSTMVKALLLVLDYLQNQQHKEFSFASKSLEDANIVTFGRALNNKLDTSKRNEIVFDLELDGFSFSITIYGDSEDTNASVSKLFITDNLSNIAFDINYSEETISVSKLNPSFVTKSDALGNVMKEFKELGLEIQKPDFKKTTPEGLRMLDEFNKLKSRVQNYYESFEKELDNPSNLFDISYPLKPNVLDKTEDTILQEFISDLLFINDAELRKLKELRDNYSETIKDNEKEKIEKTLEELFEKEDDTEDKTNFQKLESKIQELVDIDNYRSELKDSINEVIKVINKTIIYYLGANPSKQSALFSIRDKQNNLAQAIHEFKQCKIEPGDSEYVFVKHWMKEFEVGVDFKIEFYAGEAYEFYVFDQEGNKAHLADKGMGSLQAMMLILRIATILRVQKGYTKCVTVIVEEPELNLHPALQSKLTSFFHQVNREYNIEFIIETHSEYLIRKSQLFIVENEYTNQDGLNPNPFSIHYFDVDEGPYQMFFTMNGKFDRNFGEGFYDEAAKNTMALIQKQRKQE
ncbi:MAG: AAA family ATPase [Flavobacteriales bacterium]|nr:AAA family ATPase [Flavobacteriales bacterium]